MGANHGAGGDSGGLSPPEILLGGLVIDPPPQKQQVLAPLTFCNKRGHTRPIVTVISHPIFISTTEIVNCEL